MPSREWQKVLTLKLPITLHQRNLLSKGQVCSFLTCPLHLLYQKIKICCFMKKRLSKSEKAEARRERKRVYQEEMLQAGDSPIFHHKYRNTTFFCPLCGKSFETSEYLGQVFKGKDKALRMMWRMSYAGTLMMNGMEAVSSRTTSTVLTGFSWFPETTPTGRLY